MSELTLKNIKIKNKYNTYTGWASNWSSVTPALGEVYVFQVRNEVVEINGVTQAEYLHASLPIGTYTKTGDGITKLHELPWDHNIAGFVSDIISLDGELDSKADKSVIENMSRSIQDNAGNIADLSSTVADVQSDITILESSITDHAYHPSIELPEIAGTSSTFKLTYEAGALRFRFS